VLTVIASSSSVWAWLAAAADTGAGAIAAATAAHPAVRVAVGAAGAGADGFRRSHFDAVATQRLMSRRPGLRVAGFADVQLAALALQDEQRAREFVARTLGPLAGADRELRERHAGTLTARAQHATRASVQPNPARRSGGGADVNPLPAARPGRSLATIAQRDTGI
jgi:DNA-binding PucR family transcriptional regulator